jgi:F-type H+-transporting ATPase subunit a
VEQKVEQPRRYHRWIFLILLIVGGVAASFFPPIQPHVQLPAENLTNEPLFGNFYLTNTMIATLIADILLILVALGIRRAIRRGDAVPKGFPGAVSAILEMLYDMTESTAGKWAKKIFPYFATIFLLVLVVNWMELVPGVDSIGILHESDHGYPTREILPGIATLVKGETEQEGEHHEGGFGLIPFVRVASTDLNFTIALALVSVTMTQVIGFQALGAGYLTKYLNFHRFTASRRLARFGNPLDFLFGLIDIIVGFLEIIAEIAKIISFSFRLFGNIFAGSVMLFVIGSLVPVFAQSMLLALELFVGMIQAFVFGILTMVFMTQATQGHGDHGEEHAH